MSFFFGGGGSKAKPQYTGLQIQTASNAMAVALIWGKTRVAPNLIWYGDFKSHKQKQKSGKGGPKISSYTYSASIMLGLQEGPITGIGKVWKDKEETTLSDLGYSLFLGTDPQAPWGYLTSAHPTEALSYPGLAYVAAANYDLGNSANLPNHTFEMEAMQYDTFPDGGGDALPSLVIEDFLTSPQFGAGIPDSTLDDSSLFSGPDATTTGDAAYETYCRVMGFGLSPALTDQEDAGAVLQRWMQLTNSEVVWNGYLLKFVPYGTQEITANGYHYKPSLIKTPIYTLTDDDYISKDDDPLSISRIDLADVYNSMKLEFKNRDNQYNLLPVEWKDQGLIDQFGLHPGSSVRAEEITRQDMAVTSINLIGNRQAYQKNKYEFTLAPSFCLLEPTDVVVVQDPEMGAVSVIIEQIEEDEDDGFKITAREYLEGVNNFDVATAQGQPVLSTPTNSGVAPGPVNPPLIFEPPPSIVGPTAQVWAAISGGDGTTANPNWGGANVFVSTDNVTFQQIGTVDSAARQGVLTADLPLTASANPTGQTLSVTLLMSHGELQSVSTDDAEQQVTLSYIEGGEFISYETATLTGTNAYDLTGLYRGLQGTSKALRASGSQFARCDDNIFKYDLPVEQVGVTLYFKFQSFNLYGIAAEDVSTVAVYTYTPDGSGFTDPINPPNVPASISGTAGTLSNKIGWTAPVGGDRVQSYRIYGAPGTSVAFGSCSLLGSVNDPETRQWYHAIGAPGAWTYYVTAANTAGESSPVGPQDITSAATTIAGSGDVTGTPTSGQVLTWDNTLHKWKPVTPSGGGGGGAVLLDTHVCGSGETSFSFSSISQGYRELMIEFTGGSTSGLTSTSDSLQMQFNGDTSATYFAGSWWVWNNGGAAVGDDFNTVVRAALLTSLGVSGQVPGFMIIHMPRYTYNDAPQYFYGQGSGRQGNIGAMGLSLGGYWSPSVYQEITEIDLSISANAFSTGSSFKLYGIS
jgi:hypothetical protein